MRLCCLLQCGFTTFNAEARLGIFAVLPTELELNIGAVNVVPAS